jgi:hypothetical protein
MRITHLISPFSCPSASEAAWIQQMSIDSILAASETCAVAQITLASTCLNDEEQSAPAFGKRLSSMTRSSRDLGFSEISPRPLLSDLISKFSEASADAYIYTNMDIGLMPQFYSYVVQQLGKGHDALVINRRRLNHKHSQSSSLAELQSDLGRSHPGFDCFVFKAELLPKLVLGDLILGVPFVEVSLAHNLFALASKPLYVPDAHLTFHVGGDVLPKPNAEAKVHNRNIYNRQIKPQLLPHFDLKKFPYGRHAFPLRGLKHMANPALFTRDYIRMEQQSLTRRIKLRLDEWRWRFLQR